MSDESICQRAKRFFCRIARQGALLTAFGEVSKISNGRSRDRKGRKPVNDINKLYALWLEKTADKPQLRSELEAIRGHEAEISDRFYRSLEFGTGGLRGIIGAGTNRMNVYTVAQVTQGLAGYLLEHFPQPSVAVACDSRIHSDLFAEETARVLAANGIKVFFFGQIEPTPILSFAVRELGCSSGVIITASHNPSQYNGYKCYDPQGYQMTDEAALATYEHISRMDIFSGVKRLEFGEALEKGLIEMIGANLVEKFYQAVLSQQRNPGVCAGSGLKVVYTPLNGTGSVPVREILGRIGLKDLTVVPEQELPDGRFPTCPFPNPEIRQAFELALQLGQKTGADLLLATDPDCDRVGIAVPDGGEYKLMTGNEVGALLTEYILSSDKANGTLPDRPLLIKSFVSTGLAAAVAAKYGCETVNLLTGFKYIGEYITDLEKKGEAARFRLGFEESYGYLAGIHTRDKDGVVASMLICEMAAYYRSRGKNLLQVLDSLYREHGFYCHTVLNFTFEGEAGMRQMLAIMQNLRESPPAVISGLRVERVSDYLSGYTVDCGTNAKTPLALPASNVMAFDFPAGGVIVRPSGTEPKIKVYITAVKPEGRAAASQAADIAAFMKTLIEKGEAAE